MGVVAEVQEFFGVFLQGMASVGEDAFSGGAVEEGFAEFVFELADGLTDRRLRAEKLFGGARKAAFASHGEEDFEFGKFHVCFSAVPPGLVWTFLKCDFQHFRAELSCYAPAAPGLRGLGVSPISDAPCFQVLIG